MSNQVAIKDDQGSVVLENVISLKQFPPKLRVLGKYLLESDIPVSFTTACNVLNIDRNTIYKSIHRAKKKGHDFQEFIDRESQNILHKSKMGVYQALVNGAVSDSHMDRKLYFQLTGDLKESVSVGQITLAIGINVAGVIPQDDRDQGVIDVEPVIPAGK